MTNEKIITRMKSKISPLGVETLKEMALDLATKFDRASMTVSDLVMDALMDKMPEDDFCKFCEKVDAAL